MKISVLGAGAWGTALAVQAATRHEVLLWARDAQQAQAMREQRCNRRYLPEVALPDALAVDSDLLGALAHAREGLLVIATPMSGLRGMLQALPVDARALWLCKGFEASSGLLGHEIARETCPQAMTGVLSGPSFAAEVARGQPTALVAASADKALCELAVQAFHSEALRIYTCDDPVGVEVGGAVKNVLAIATGLCDGLDLGLNARAALITRGLAEMTRLGLALGAQVETFMGLSGLGDLVLTATGDLSRNRRVGLQLAAGKTLAQVLAELGHVAEGVYSAATVARRAHDKGVEMPITEAVVAVLEGRLTPQQAVWQLMQRAPNTERCG
ncbi:NAD(P)H-dependent glycerol-3-phosphate dehydrogenase [Azohydromonas caseinilytica]|uniref:Glycerol-3-phosphate dehydrogenase [NAD(P)+] n=1 Tax=Azohydromonas caseinilytica TaxID=2728836 RepID=A0A848F6D2_9BURK|nr:NAD(P)H-dependent glycerol-3-phosphate dehydrogenase [Azohydromonas caseinilytica]NML15134.1 NAD(P)-dependent glycerol-3-phosphate dehydrogenase [Azohydromonas caseinilytica]